MEQGGSSSRVEGERLLGMAEKLLHSRDLNGSRQLAMLAQQTEPLLDGSEQILAITDVILASERRVNNNRHHDWYAILQTEHRSDLELIKKNYRRLALLLHPDKNNFPLADSAFKLVADAWGVLSDPVKRAPFDQALSLFSKVQLRRQSERAEREKVVRAEREKVMREMREKGEKRAEKEKKWSSSFWTACPYCYVVYEYSGEYEEFCLKCQNCERAFHASQIPSLPPLVPGKEAYYCCWGFYPLSFSLSSDHNNNNVNNNTRTNENPGWMPDTGSGMGMFTPTHGHSNRPNVNVNVTVAAPAPAPAPAPPPPPPPAPVGVGVGVGGSSSGVYVSHQNQSTGAFGSGNATTHVHVSSGSGMGGMPTPTPAPAPAPAPGPRKRGRPRKNPFPV